VKLRENRKPASPGGFNVEELGVCQDAIVSMSGSLSKKANGGGKDGGLHQKKCFGLKKTGSTARGGGRR